MKRLALIIVTAFQLSAMQALASGTIGYGSRAGQEVNVISMSGLNSSHAVIKTKHTRENAVKFCLEYVQHVSRQCIEEELSLPLKNEIHADCNTGVFVDFFGNAYRFEGRLNRTEGMEKDDFIANFAVRDLDTGEIEDGSLASGYPVNMGIFAALCSLKAPSADDW